MILSDRKLSRKPSANIGQAPGLSLLSKAQRYLRYFAFGIVLGLLFIKTEVVSWYRIQEMFRLQSFHLYGVILCAVSIGAGSVWLIKKLNIKTIEGESVNINQKKFHKGHIYGGITFGIGWAMTGACPGSLFVQLGTGATFVVVTLLSAIAGTWVYGRIRNKLPH